jgi:hypothetical protein
MQKKPPVAEGGGSSVQLPRATTGGRRSLRRNWIAYYQIMIFCQALLITFLQLFPLDKFHSFGYLALS